MVRLKTKIPAQSRPGTCSYGLKPRYKTNAKYDHPYHRQTLRASITEEKVHRDECDDKPNHQDESDDKLYHQDKKAHCDESGHKPCHQDESDVESLQSITEEEASVLLMRKAKCM